MSTVLALMVMFGVVSAFALIGQGVSDSRATLEMSGQLRQVATMLKNDLGGVTAVMSPPRSPESGEGYFEYTEGPIGPVLPVPPWGGSPVVAYNNDTGMPDTTVGDIDDMLIFTVRSRTEPFVGRCAGMPGGTAESYDAEVIWFVRGRTLYRRVLLIPPASFFSTGGRAGFFAGNDISVHMGGPGAGAGDLVANSLADLTKPENRFAHRAQHSNGGAPTAGVPYHPHFRVDSSLPVLIGSGWGAWSFPGNPTHPGTRYLGPGLPTLRECSSQIWDPGFMLPYLGGDWSGPPIPGSMALQPTAEPFDAWKNPYPWQGVDPSTGTLPGWPPNLGFPPRIADDVVLNNVIGFDVKAWDPGAPVLALLASGQILLPGDPGYLFGLQNVGSGYQIVSYGAYVDLNYGCPLGPVLCGNLVNSGSVFAGPGDARSRTYGTDPAAPGVLRSAVYDTWSTHYERELGNGQASDGFDNDAPGSPGYGIVDDPGEQQFPPPYAAPLRGIQVKIRVFEPDSRQVREVTVIQEFVTK